PLRIRANVERDQIFRFAHRELQAEALAEPPGEAYVVGVKVGGDDPRQSAPPKRSGDERLPRRARLRVINSRIDGREPVSVLDQVDVDVIEPERKGKARPEHARTNLDRFARLRRIGVREDKRLGRRAIEHTVLLKPAADWVNRAAGSAALL